MEEDKEEDKEKDEDLLKPKTDSMARIVLTFYESQTKDELIDKIGWWSNKNGTKDFEYSVKKGIISQRGDGKWELAKDQGPSFEINESVRVLLQYPPRQSRDTIISQIAKWSHCIGAVEFERAVQEGYIVKSGKRHWLHGELWELSKPVTE